MKKLIFTAACLVTGSLGAQVLPSPGASPAPQSAPASSSPSGGGGGGGGSGSSQGGDNSIFGGLMPHVDGGSETVTWDGKMWNMNNNRIARAKFEIYLATPEAKSAEDQAYRDIIAQITLLLAPTRQGGPDVSKAFALLPEAGAYPIDGGICNTIANGVWDVWLAQRKVTNLRQANDAMLKRRKDLEWNTEQGMNTAPLTPSTSGGPTKGNANQRQQAVQQVQTNNTTFGRVSGYIKSIAEIEGRMKMNETAIGLSEVTSKTQFQALMVQLFMQRRFEHAIIACRLYPHMFRDGDSVLQLDDNSDLKKMFSASMGMPPTVSLIDGFASEAIRGVDEAVVAFEQLVLRQDYDSASKRLMEAYAVGEFLPRIRRLPMATKLKVLDYVRDGNQLINALEMRDFGLAEELVKKLRLSSSDFDYSKPLAAIETARTLSDMRLTAARAAAVKGDQAGVAAELKGAAEIWPTNPKLREVSNMIGQNSDVQAQALLDLDRLLSQRNYRQVFNDQGRFLASAINDPLRQEQLKKVLTDMNRVNMVVHAAGESARNGNSFGAWEAIEREYEQFPDDPEITKLRSDLSVKASEFVSAIEKAKQHEQRKQSGSAIAWYLKARRLYPPSEFARNGIQRLVAGLNATGETSVDGSSTNP
ncbi:hypothetical protein EI77_02094 [Prosthecobacter fusiformis]|uniref:Tetratricopeptide repeat protein n=1 Tax=Prosthecobacter fusiformis TaxID=48464 RepID=A0A4R7S0K3_9BACT|nr:hypothetical protein [Prosthecobacter fusiformis]TDU70976.1 hypothetical protein EI77_02094 [Prosthecobacter fusiformis]